MRKILKVSSDLEIDYAMFTSIRTLLVMDGIDCSKHAGVISFFQKEYIKSGMIDKKYSKYLSQAFQIRNKIIRLAYFTKRGNLTFFFCGERKMILAK